jgi:hypothetical protein
MLERAKTVRALDRSATAIGSRIDGHADDVAPSIPKKFALTSPTSGSRSVGIVRSRIQAIEFLLGEGGAVLSQRLRTTDLEALKYSTKDIILNVQRPKLNSIWVLF